MRIFSRKRDRPESGLRSRVDQGIDWVAGREFFVLKKVHNSGLLYSFSWKIA
jgi:hypothetical protein